jgi:hypothetical protein
MKSLAASATEFGDEVFFDVSIPIAAMAAVRFQRWVT